jgi:ADP-ribose pyrophosphatase YjhB (NUDIX family)
LLPFDKYAEALNKKRTAAGIVFRDRNEKVLLAKPYYKDSWDIPGGAVDADEAPWECAQRELKEELGLDRPIGRLLVVDYLPQRDVLPEGIAFIFDGGIMGASELDLISFVDSEITAVEFYGMSDVWEKVVPQLARRIAAAVRAIDLNEAVMCVEGTRV